MPKIPVNQLGRGNAVLEDGAILVVVSMEHVKPGKGPAYQQTKFRNIETGRIVEKRLRTNDTVERIDVDRQSCTFSYRNGDTFVFMNSSTYEEVEVPAEVLGDDTQYLLEGEEVTISIANGRVLTIELPPVVDLVVTQCDPGVKNATATNVYKNAEVETGMTVQVPPFINQGDKVRIRTESGEYLERVATA